MSFILIANNGTRFTVTQKAAWLSTLIKEITCEKDLNETQELPLNVDEDVLASLVEWMTYHADHDEDTEKIRKLPKPLKNKLEKLIGEFDLHFLKSKLQSGSNIKPMEVLANILKIVKAADYMNMPELLQLCMACIADVIMTFPPEDIRETFGLPREFSEEEKEKIKSCLRY